MFWCFDPDGDEVSVRQWMDVGQHGPDDNLAVDHIGEVVVKTFWYGLVFEVDGGPRIFETFVYGGAFVGCRWTYRTVEEARRGHAMVVAHLRRLDRSLVHGDEIDGPAAFGMTAAWVPKPAKAEVEEWLAARRL